MSGFLESSNGFDFLLEERKYCGSAKYDNIAKFLKRSMSGGELVQSDRKMVNINSLRGKIVGLFFMSHTTVVDRNGLMDCILDLANAYNELSKSKKGQFEIVWIAKDLSCLQFSEYLEMMPWLAIPYTDSVARTHLCNLAEIKEPHGYDIFLFNRRGKLFRKNAADLFKAYGADWYPFTDIRIDEIADEDYAIGTNKSLEMLLANPTRDFVLKNDGTQLRISELEDKVVGIYLCDMDDHFMTIWFTQKLYEVYCQLQREGKEFEVVTVHIGGWGRKKSLKTDFKEWYSLPCRDSNSKRLVRMFEPDSDIKNRLIIVGQRGSFVNNFGYNAIRYFGVEGYPFSRLCVVEMEKKRLEELSLNSLLTCGDKNYVIRNSGEKIPVASLRGKTIVLLFTESSGKRKSELVLKLMKWYQEIKLKDDDFEVILVARNYDEMLFSENFGRMPWLALPLNDTRILTLCSALRISYPTLAVFGPNGQLVSMKSEFHFYEKGSNAYPFSVEDLLMDVCRVLSRLFEWPEEYDDKHMCGWDVVY